MTDFILRPADNKDLEQIICIWQSAFGDDEGFIRDLMEDCGLLKTAVCAELDGKGRSFMFAFDGLKLAAKRAAYIYALCTEPSYRGRGLGRAVTLYAAKMAAARGAEIVFLKPANTALEEWYASILGAVPFAGSVVEKIQLSAPGTLEAEEISPAEYLKSRGKSSCEVPISLILAQDCVHRHYGGGFFRCGENLVCAEKRDTGILVRELIGSDVPTALAAVAKKLGLDEFYFLKSCPDGSPFMAIPPFIPRDDSSLPLMPFTID